MRIRSFNIFKANKLEIHELNNTSRDKNILRQVFSSFTFKILSVAIGLALVPILLSKLGTENYGVWAILLSLMQWVALMDIGIGNGLRNKLGEALAHNRTVDAREYVSTAYFSMVLFAVVLIVILLPVFFLFDWSVFFNSKSVSPTELRWTLVVFIYAIITYFVLSLINQVINALQRNALTSIAPIVANVLFIGSITLFLPKHNASLLLTSIAYAVSLLGAVLAITIFFFKEYSYLSPKLVFFKKDKIRSILSLGLKFFIIQITCVVIFSTDNVVITQLFGPKAVTAYSIPFMIFNNIGMLINLMMMPFYSSYTEAYSKNNLEWIRAKIVLLCKLMIPFVLGVLVVVFIFPYLLKIWIKDPIDIPKSLPLLMGLYTVITVWNNIFGYLMGAIGKINLGMYVTIITGVINIPLSIYLGRNCGLGLNGVIISNIICLGFNSIICPIQVYYFIFSKKQTPRWDKILS